MKTKLITLALVSALTISAFADLKSDTQKRFDKYCAASKKMDIKGVEKALRDTFAPDFKFTPKKGQGFGLAEWIEHEKMQMTMTESVKSVKLHIDKVTMGKGTATMKVSMSYEGMAKMDPKGKAGLLKYVATSDLTMVQKNSKWWVSEMKEDKSSGTFNGKPIPGM